MEIEIMTEGEGLVDVEALKVSHGGSLNEVIAIVAKRGGYAGEEAFIFVEDEDQPLDITIAVVTADSAKRVHHVHRLKEIEVVVFYGGQQISHKFAPSARVQKVLRWAVGPRGFKNIDPAIVPEMELTIHGQTESLPHKAHIGRFVKHPHGALKLDLTRPVIPNG
jgi:hypothetical protein